jgi:phenylalanyl-tRNA synthetase beta chain
VPSRRGDITRTVDLIEEVARLYGYDNIPTTLMTGVTTPGALNKEQAVRRLTRNLLTGSGLHEAITYSFTHPQQISEFPGAYQGAQPIALSMPMSEDRSTLRTSLIPHLLDAAAYNRNRNMNDVAVFEIGKVFITSEAELTKLPDERLLLAILMTGKRQEAHWTGKSGDVDFYDVKGAFDSIASYLGLSGAIGYSAAQPEGFHPGRTASITLQTADGVKVIGTIGQLHPELQQKKDLADTYVLEVELSVLASYADLQISYQPLPRYPSIGRDTAVVVNRDVQVGDLTAKVKEVAGGLLESIQVFDIYTGDRLGADKKSVALALVYRTAERTLTDEEVSELHAKVVSALETTFGAELRK